jgi:hypothetical protein
VQVPDPIKQSLGSFQIRSTHRVSCQKKFTPRCLGPEVVWPPARVLARAYGLAYPRLIEDSRTACLSRSEPGSVPVGPAHWLGSSRSPEHQLRSATCIALSCLSLGLLAAHNPRQSLWSGARPLFSFGSFLSVQFADFHSNFDRY